MSEAFGLLAAAAIWVTAWALIRRIRDFEEKRRG